MKQVELLATMLMMMSITSTAPTRAVFVDRLLAAVNDQVICQSNVAMVMSLADSGLLGSKTARLTPEAALDQCIDRLVLLQEIRRSESVIISADAILAVIRLQSGEDDPQTALVQKLKKAGWSWEEYVAREHDEMELTRFIEARFAAFIVVTDEEVDRRLRTEFDASPETVTEQELRNLMKELIKQEHINERLSLFMTDLRKRNHIKKFVATDGGDASESPAPPSQQEQ